MHIAFITSEYPHCKVKSAAGIGTSIKNLSEELVKLEVQISIFIYGQDCNEVFYENGINYHLISDKNYVFGRWYFYRKYINDYIDAQVKLDNIDIIEAADWTGITAFMKFEIPLVIRFHGSDTYFCHLENRKQKFKNYFFEKKAVQNADALVAPTKFAGDLSRKLFNVCQKNYLMIHHGINLEIFHNANPDSFEQGTLIYVGSIIRKKGVLEIPKIFSLVRKQIPNVKLIVIGADCPDLATGQESTWNLMQSLFSLEDIKSVSYLGLMPYNKVQDYLINANVCIFPSFAETFGMVTIEAMALQKAVINSNIGWAHELMENGSSGYLVDPTNHLLYAKKIAQILEDKSRTAILGKNARDFILAKFDIKNIAKENLAFYERIVAQ